MSALPRVPGFEVEGLLGRGGMGTVYRAREVVTRRGVALKWLPAHAKPEQRARFEREARAAATLEHPHVVRVHAAGTDANGCWIAMELVEGFDLAEAIEARSLDQRVAVEIVAKVARALEAAHAAGIVHRDVKPANIMVDEKGEPRLVDFGLASIVRDAAPPLTRPNTILGTVAYMSPEVASSGALVATAASDVFSLGCVLYEVLTGRLPFAAPTAVESMVRLISGEMDPFDEKTPPSLAAACRRALARDPAARPRAGDLASELEAALGSATKAKPVTGGRWLVPAALLLAAIVLGAGLALALTPDAKPAPPPAPVPSEVPSPPPAPVPSEVPSPPPTPLSAPEPALALPGETPPPNKLVSWIARGDFKTAEELATRGLTAASDEKSRKNYHFVRAIARIEQGQLASAAPDLDASGQAPRVELVRACGAALSGDRAGVEAFVRASDAAANVTAEQKRVAHVLQAALEGKTADDEAKVRKLVLGGLGTEQLFGDTLDKLHRR